MKRYIRHAAAFCALLLIALLVNATRVQVFQAGSLDANEANRRNAIVRFEQPRGDILVDGRPVTGSRDTGEQLRYERTYRNGPLYAPVTGYASQVYGTTFLEHAEDDILSGTDPMLAPLPLWNDITRAQNPGGKVETTIKAAVQQAAYAGLGGKRGAVAALEPSTGKILALVSAPSYDPERLSGTDRAVADTWAELNGSATKPMLNRAIRQTYPPGSTFKVVTAAAALDAGEVTDLDAPTKSPNPYTLPGTSTQLTNEVDGCKNASLRYAFQWSCNTVFAKLGVDTGLTPMAGTARDFGFNDSGLRIPSSVAASNFDTSMDRAQLGLSAIGQYDTRATPLQMAMVAAAVANGGSVKAPHLVDRTTTEDGDVVDATGARTLRQAMNPGTAAQLREMMAQVVDEGTGTNAAIPGVTVGGKTGTAQHGIDNSGTPYAWFISWAQAADDPEPSVAVAVVVEDAAADRGDISGGGSAAPIAKAVMEAAIGAH
ncbi:MULTISPECIES: penicillin-binding transpeptidase domain-containing protein [unclassified Streptomyces]|uniref:penicillin-binding transpeptidase domain-containing protein n=1 Tax=unclassified Streptomyces TaxID=2593676 RepID=UPI001369D802|nr:MULTISPECIES: penicillin-binding transpeptidase domain-containing protein [unclassified Streptomyces]NEA04697.1 penicillin-binding protein 2 [Streptomyces sp. SID10116]MYY80082.1 penicillin-binding protein 2 [Streptomyces sp. SID335]MYZ12067.1 penicillin-binding protein 2 [Streptomyces sp. SID337]NDZ88549.1 penicillin-binding protein 2 [Streptomyces sp. SID10115]NEB48830.1 penicillin-binding protein 2 [Streptomyces sp. SID339]